MRNSTRTEKILPFILAILLPGLFYLNNITRFRLLDIFNFALIWLVASVLILMLWYSNIWIDNKFHKNFYIIAILFNLVFVVLFVFIITKILPANIKTTPSLYKATSLRFIFVALIFVTIQQSLKSARTLAKLKLENQLLKTEKYKAELDQLRKQVNPHFLFNSLSTLRTMIRNSDQNSEKFVMNLSTLYRQILQTNDKDYITLKEEIEFLNAYIYLLKHRYEDALEIHIEINPESYQYFIPVFTLQILVENCVKHNIVGTNAPLRIKIYQNDEFSVTVANNFQPKHEATGSTGVGLSNLSNRYKLMGIEQGLVIEKSNNQYSATVKLFEK